jgi:glycine betaine/choline ABC-type transport system substrate-binding protein
VRRKHPILALVAILCLGLAFAACGGDDSSSSGSSSSSGGGGGGGGGGESASNGTQIQKAPGAESTSITVGSKNFTEQFVLGEIYAQALQAAGYNVKKQLNLGSELIAYKALKAGKVDAYPEYTGTALTSFFGVKTTDVPRDANKAYEDAKAGFAKNGITAFAPTPFENTYRLGMTKATAQKLGNPTKISDLKGKEGNLKITGFPECKQRNDCLIGVEDTYGLKFGKFVSSEQKYQVLDSGAADVAFIFTTDGDLASGKYVILDDDKKFFPPYNVTFNVRDEVAKKLGPEGQKVIEEVQKPLTEKVMQELNARVDIDKQKPAAAAKAYLQSAGFIPKS